DLPWNPAELEQRIGRVHRLGQRQPVQVVNFVAQGTIEEGMLSVLKFKQSLFAGVLDGGEKEVFLGGSRLTKFMETVEKAAAAIPEPTYEDETGALRPVREAEAEPEAAEAEPEPAAPPALGPAAADPWSGLLQNGLAILEQVTAAARPQAPAGAGNGLALPGLVARDERTGETYLKLPMPKPEVLDRALQV